VVPFEGDFSVMIDSAQFCHDFEITKSFYVDLLGLTSVFNMKLPQGLIDPVVQTPPGTTCRMAFLVKPGAPVPAVELIGTDAPAGYLDRGEGVPGYGIFGLAMEVEDLAGTLSKISSAGYKILAGPMDLGQAGMPARKAALVEGPNRIALEFYEKA
jgi:catechol 2,3-dioxygenase-like lactoylglutathione lyase family enzyme